MRQHTIEVIESLNAKTIDTKDMIDFANKKAKGLARMVELSEFAAKEGNEDFHMIQAAHYRYEQRHMEAILDRLRLVKSMVEAVTP